MSLRTALARLPSRGVGASLPRLSALPRFARSYADAAPTGMDEGERNIHSKLAARFPGKRLEVQDVSGGCGSFYAILVSSPAFKGLSTIKQHKLVNEVLKEDIKGIHGLQVG
ncbi:hypothetical protein JCM24511_03455 [Saitozyma sp. JCM 24511]|nr:hypothetical protein JCM24511_03455 [Saitozyma sp. JCM 24511]